jgi:hypothetical protein
VAERRLTYAEQAFALSGRCEKCGCYAFVTRCGQDAFKHDGTEIWTYECVDCDHKMRRTVKPSRSQRRVTVS